MNKFIKISYATSTDSLKIYEMKEMLGYQVDEVTAALRMSLSLKL